MIVLHASTTLEDFLADAPAAASDRVQRIGFVLAAAGILVATGVGALTGPIGPDDRNLLRRIGLLGGLVAAIGASLEAIAWSQRLEVGWLDALRGDQGTAPMMRLLGGVLIVVGLAESARDDDLDGGLDDGRRPPASMFATAGVAVGLLSFAFDGHTVSKGPRVVHALVDTAHVTGAGVWVGGVVGLAALAIRAPLTGRRALVLHRFATTAMVCLVVVAFAGATMAAFILDRPGDLTATPWGRLLVVKMSLVVACVAVGSYHHVAISHRIGKGDDTAAVRGRARVTLAVESVLLIAVIVVTARLVATSPV